MNKHKSTYLMIGMLVVQVSVLFDNYLGWITFNNDIDSSKKVLSRVVLVILYLIGLGISNLIDKE